MENARLRRAVSDLTLDTMILSEAARGTYYGGNNSVFKTCNFDNPALGKLIETARFAKDDGEYKKTLSDTVAVVMKDVPRIPIAQLLGDVAMQPNVQNYVYRFHQHIDYRTIKKV